MKTILRILAVLSICGVVLAQQSYVKFEPSPGANPRWDTNIANVIISNVTFHGKVTFINNSNSPSLWNTNGAGLYTPSDTLAHSIRFGSNNVMGVGVRHSAIFGTGNTNGSGSWSTVIFGTNNWILNDSPGSTISGGADNLIMGGVLAGTIGGGMLNQLDATLADRSVIAGGWDNQIRENLGAILGGQGNDARGIGNVIVGGLNNVSDRGDYSFVGGGEANIVRGDWAAIGGGRGNNLHSDAAGDTGANSVVAGGNYNTIGISGQGATYSFIGGGSSNSVLNRAGYSVLAGGSFNQIGDGNIVSGNVIGGGFNNLIDSTVDFSVIAGGFKNTTAADWTTILGGVSNNVTATYAMAIGNFLTNATTKSVEIGADNLGKVRFTTRNSGSQISLGDTNGLGGRINLYASTNSGAATLYVEGSPTSQTTPPSSVTTNLSIAGLATLHISNGIIYAVTGP